MAKQPAKKPAPSPDDNRWVAPDSDQEFVFESIDSAPAWVDRAWAGFDRGPALNVPDGDLSGNGPYSTSVARIGDTVKFTAAKGASPAKLQVLAGTPDPETMSLTVKPAQESAVSIEDALRTGAMEAGDLGDDAKAQVAGRTPAIGREVKLD